MTNSWETLNGTPIFENKCEVIEKENAVIQLFNTAFQIYDPREVFVAFNGGKDGTVLLHLLAKYFQNGFLKHVRFPVLYIRSEDSFAEIDQFVDDCATRYNIELIKMTGPLKAVLSEYLSVNPKMKACFMGCRQTDPYCETLKVMQSSDPGWPSVMRINPLLSWNCRDIWSYIFAYKVTYCSLYDEGYTSIGNKKDTIRNPRLLSADGTYLPAYELLDDSAERLGRVQNLN